MSLTMILLQYTVDQTSAQLSRAWTMALELRTPAPASFAIVAIGYSELERPNARSVWQLKRRVTDPAAIPVVPGALAKRAHDNFARRILLLLDEARADAMAADFAGEPLADPIATHPGNGATT